MLLARAFRCGLIIALISLGYLSLIKHDTISIILGGIVEDLIIVEGVKKTVFGLGAVNQLVAESETLGASRPLLIMDRALAEMDICTRIQGIMEKGGLKAVPYFEVTPNPRQSLRTGVHIWPEEKRQTA